MSWMKETSHIWITVGLAVVEDLAQIGGAPYLGLPLFGASFFLGREVAQAEYRYIEKYGGKRDAVPWWCALYPEAWTVKAVLDWVGPLVVAITNLATHLWLN